MTASSVRSLGDFAASNGRLNGPKAWCAHESKQDNRQWWQVDFGKERTVAGVALQGYLNDSVRIKTYFMNYSSDSVDWKVYSEDGSSNRVRYEDL